MSFEIETGEYILLGGQISEKLKIFKDLAQLADNAFIWAVLENYQKIKEQKTILDKAKMIIYLEGQTMFMQNQTSELTKLSAILGDTRTKYSAKGLRDDITARINAAPEP